MISFSFTLIMFVISLSLLFLLLLTMCIHTLLYRGDALVEEVLELVRKHRPVQISFIGAGLHWLHEKPLRMGLKVGHLIDLSLAVGRRFAR